MVLVTNSKDYKNVKTVDEAVRLEKIISIPNEVPIYWYNNRKFVIEGCHIIVGCQLCGPFLF